MSVTIGKTGVILSLATHENKKDGFGKILWKREFSFDGNRKLRNIILLKGFNQFIKDRFYLKRLIQLSQNDLRAISFSHGLFSLEDAFLQ